MWSSLGQVDCRRNPFALGVEDKGQGEEVEVVMIEVQTLGLDNFIQSFLGWEGAYHCLWLMARF